MSDMLATHIDGLASFGMEAFSTTSNETSDLLVRTKAPPCARI
jgi:hypothetical protein